MTFQDICKANESKTPESMLIVKTNQDTLIEVPEPMYVSIVSHSKSKLFYDQI